MADPPATPNNRPLPWRSHLAILGLGVASFLLFRLVSLTPGLVESVYSRNLNPFLIRIASHITGLLPIPVFEPLVIVYIGRKLFLGGKALVAVLNKSRTFGNTVAAGLLSFGRDAGVIITLFYIMWGFNYAQRPLRERLGWAEFTTPEVEILADLARESVAAANKEYLEIHDSTDAGAPTRMPEDLRSLDEALESGWQAVTRELALDPHFANRYGPGKRLLLTPIVSRFGISGLYFPWTAEANVLWDSPPVMRPQSMAHEKAHQRGVGPEEEASFLGYMAASRSPNAMARYSAHVFAQIQLLRVLAAEDPETARTIADERYPGVQLDLEAANEYWVSRRGVATAVGRALNHQFLKANRVTGGVASYRMSVRLIITQLLHDVPAT